MNGDLAAKNGIIKKGMENRREKHTRLFVVVVCFCLFFVCFVVVVFFWGGVVYFLIGWMSFILLGTLVSFTRQRSHYEHPLNAATTMVLLQCSVSLSNR